MRHEEARSAAGQMRPSRLLVVILVAAAALFSFAASASAEIVREHIGNFGPEGPAAEEIFGYPGPTAIDESTGTVYVGDMANSTIQKFDAAGNPVDFASTPGSSKIEEIYFIGGNGEAQMAVSQVNHDIYTQWGNATVKAFKANGEPDNFSAGPGAGTNELGGFSYLLGVATDSNGNIYVGDYEQGKVFVYAPTGAALTNFETSTPGNIAVDPTGNVYVVHWGGAVEKYAPSAYPVTASTTYASTGVVDEESTISVAVNPANSHLFVDHGFHVTEYDATGAELGKFGNTAGPGELLGSQGLAIAGDTSTAYVANVNSGRMEMFKLRNLPKASAAVASGQDRPTALITGEIDPDSAGDVTDCEFEYGTTTAYELGSVDCEQALPYSGLTEVSASISGLEALTTYHYRISATNSEGTRHSADKTFFLDPLMPAVTGTSFSEVKDTSAKLEAAINPGFGPTIYRFQYGTSTGYGSQTLPGPSVGEDDTEHPAWTTLSGLEPGTTYHFRAVATNFSGTVFGPDQSFTTPAQPDIGSVGATVTGKTSATLATSVNPGLSETTVKFEYGTSQFYGSTTDVTELAADNLSHSVNAALAGLSAGTTYHFRVVAENEFGTSTTADAVFTTQAEPPAVVTPPTPAPVKCKKGFVKKHGKCVKRKKKHHKKKHRKPGGRHA